MNDLSRRRFISRWLSTVGAAVSLPQALRALPPNHRYRRRIGVQLWTVRDLLAADPEKTLRAIKDLGYFQVEPMDVMTQTEVITQARRTGLAVTSSFFDWQVITAGLRRSGGKDELTRGFDQVLSTAERLGLSYLVYGYLGHEERQLPDVFSRLAGLLNRAGEMCQSRGIQLCYHNHNFEFQPRSNGKTGYDLLIQNLDPERVKFEVDVFWAAMGGQDPAPLIQRLKGRVAQLHLKDVKRGFSTGFDELKVPLDSFKELGNGVLDLRAVIHAGMEAGAEQAHVEQDVSPDPVRSLEISMRYLAGA